MNGKVKPDDVAMAMIYVQEGQEFGSEAYIDRNTGMVLYAGADDSDLDDEIPDDVHSNERYLSVPGTSELGLGRDLAIAFADAHLPDHQEQVRKLFRSNGAFRRFKSLLAELDREDDWYTYEAQRTREAIRDWAEENDVQLEEN